MHPNVDLALKRAVSRTLEMYQPVKSYFCFIMLANS